MADAAVFLDRDGTLIEDAGYAVRPEQIRILGGVARALADLAHAGYKLIVVTNQSGLARGLATEADLERFHQALDEQLDMLGVRLDAYYVCPHYPGIDDSPRPDLAVECECRKPKPGLIFRAAADFGIDLAASWMVGDTWRDIAAGQAAGVKTIKLPADVHHDFARPPDVGPPTAQADGLAAAARIILGITDARTGLAEEAPEAEAPPQEAPAESVAEEISGPEEPREWTQVEALDLSGEEFEETQDEEPFEPATPQEAVMVSAGAPPPAAVAEHCARCGQDVSESDLADGRAGRRDGFLFCAECLSLQPRETADTLAGGETDMLRAILAELRRLNRAQRTSGLTWLRLLAYVVQAGALFCGLVLGLVGDDKALYFQIAVFLQLVVVALVLFERKP